MEGVEKVKNYPKMCDVIYTRPLNHIKKVTYPDQSVPLEHVYHQPEFRQGKASTVEFVDECLTQRKKICWKRIKIQTKFFSIHSYVTSS